MHRGSSKGARKTVRPSESLPLSASPASVAVDLEIARAGRSEQRHLDVAPGTLVRAALRSIGQSPEGCAVLLHDVPIPLDTPIERATRLTVIPTFSGG
jgi:sulfur carrier protein ThiS